jgi:hypothetical protein
MTDQVGSKDCMEFKQRLEEGLELGSAIYGDPHLLSCSRCKELVRELDRIADIGRDYYWRQG